MDNRINPYHNRLVNPFPQTGQRSEVSAREAEAPRPPERATPPEKQAPPEGLSRVEQQMIERYFPKSETMTLRLYGANRSAQTLNPGAVGTHLDVRG
jgi:hypothetical protein